MSSPESGGTDRRARAEGPLRRLVRRLSQACLVIAVVQLGLLAGLVVLQVIARNGFDLGLPWADELARFCSLSLVFLSLPLLALRGRHVAVEMLPQVLGGRWRVIMAGISEIGVFVFCAFTLYGMQNYLARAGKFATPAMGMSNWLLYAPAAIGITLLLLVALLRLSDIARGRARYEDPQVSAQP